MAIHSLNALMGNINKTGGVFVKPEVPLTPLPPVVMDEEAARGYAVDRLDGAGSAAHPFSKSLPGNLKADEIRMLFVHDSNPYYAMPEQNTAHELFEKAPFIVALSCCMNESAARADLILPLNTGLEKWDDQIVAPDSPHPIYNLSRPLVEPLYDNKDAGGVLIEIAKTLGGTIAESFPWASMGEVLEMRVQGIHETGRGMIASPDAMAMLDRGLGPEGSLSQQYPSFASLWKKLLEDNCWFDPEPHHGPLQKALLTPSKKFEFYSQRLKDAFGFEEDAACMPHYEEASLNKDGFDLVIMAEDTLTMADDGKDTPPFLMKQLSDNVLKGNELFVRINPITALYHDLEEGDRVIVESPRGKVEVRLHLFEGVREGVVLIPLGFGHSAYDEFLRDKGVNANEVLEAKTDTITGLPIWWATPGKITKV
jgi:anaerobic selenocysteine-containing dehydrogenase